ncbi:MAG: DUF2062 domain-containing protein [Hyphomicrobiales bacterium]|nr:DUF2062 domain-containing protein [Hyphomicrobiales bacterium]
MWYMFHRLARLPGTAYSIAGGFACGAAISFTPFVGLHFILGGLWAWATRANIIASAIGTAVGNPWTFPFIWIWIYKLGLWMGAGDPAAGDLDFARLFSDMVHATLNLDFAFLYDVVWPVWWPMFVGSLPTAVVAWFVFYWPLKVAVGTYQRRRLQRRRKNLEKA